MSGAAARTLVFLLFAVTGVVLAVGLILPGRGLLADALRDVLAPWFGAGRWLLPPALITFGVWFERRAEKSRASILHAVLAIAALPALLAIIEIILPERGGLIGSIAGNGVASLLTPIGALAAWLAVLTGIGLVLAEGPVRRAFAALFGGAKAGAIASAEAIARGVEELAERRDQAQREREARAAEAPDAEDAAGQIEERAALATDEPVSTPLRAPDAAAVPLSATFAPARTPGASLRDGASVRGG